MIEAESPALPRSATLNTGMPVLSFLDVSKDYLADGQPIRALSRVSLQVEQGEFVALVGRSGCGKSTLLNLAGAMDFPTSGQVLLDGLSTSSLDDAGLTRLRREKVGFIFQSFQLLPTLSVIENIELPSASGGPRQRAFGGAGAAAMGGPRWLRRSHAASAFWRTDAARGHRARVGAFAAGTAGR